MADIYAELASQGAHDEPPSLESSEWLLWYLLETESADLAIRLIANQIHAARLPIHHNLRGLTSVSPFWIRL